MGDPNKDSITTHGTSTTEEPGITDDIELLEGSFVATLPCKTPFRLGAGKFSLSGQDVEEFVPAVALKRSFSTGSLASDCTSYYSVNEYEDEESDEIRTNSHAFLDLADLNVSMFDVDKIAESAADSVIGNSPSSEKIMFQRKSSSFLRVADLEMEEEEETVACSSVDAESTGGTMVPNFHHMAVDPPPGVDLDPKERWVVLDDGCGSNTYAPVAPAAVRALAKSGFKSSFDRPMWVADSKTAKVLKQTPDWNDVLWQDEGPIRLPDSVLNESEVFVWSGNFSHGHYGSDLPAVRAGGIINLSPKELLNLLVDSRRVKEYNKLCVGRTDLLTLQADDHLEGGPFGGITKVMKSESKPPMLRTTLQFTSLLHARALNDDSGYKMVTRAVTLPEDKEDLANSLKSEILLGATILKKIEGHENKTLFISINHLRSPMVPTIIAKRIGLSAAANFIGDLRGVVSA